jgi:hypothetical protein
LAPIGDEEIGEAVVIIIAGADALSPAGVGQPELARYLAETAAALVVIHAAGTARSRDDKDIEQPVVIVVDESDAAAVVSTMNCLEAAPPFGIAKSEPGRGRYIAEVRGSVVSPAQRETEKGSGEAFHLEGAFSPMRFRKSVNSPSGGRCSFSSSAFSLCASALRPALR